MPKTKTFAEWMADEAIYRYNDLETAGFGAIIVHKDDVKPDEQLPRPDGRFSNGLDNEALIYNVSANELAQVVYEAWRWGYHASPPPSTVGHALEALAEAKEKLAKAREAQE